MNKRVLLLGSILIFGIAVVLLIVFFPKYRNLLPIAALRTDIASSTLQSTPNPNNQTQALINKYPFDATSNSGVQAFPTEPEAVIIFGTVKNTRAEVAGEKNGSLEIDTLKGVLTVIVDTKTLYSSVNADAKSITEAAPKQLQGLGEIPVGGKVQVKAYFSQSSNLIAEYVEEHR